MEKKLKFKEKEENISEISGGEKSEIVKMNFRCEITDNEKFIEKRSVAEK